VPLGKNRKENKMIDQKEKEKFAAVCESVIAAGHTDMGIGSLGEKYMHRILKTFLCADTDCHEVGQGSFVADVVVEDTIYEIQTGGYYPLKKKLEYYLSEGDKRIIIVTPVIRKSRLIWVDPETGATKPGRLTTRPMAWTGILREIFYLCGQLDFHRVGFWFPVLAVDDYRKLDGYGKDRKIRATKIERIPRELLDMEEASEVADVARLFVPESLPERFFAKDFSALTGARRMGLSACLRALEALDIITRDGKQGNAIVYRRLI
jgi:hypothetical protein